MSDHPRMADEQISNGHQVRARAVIDVHAVLVRDGCVLLGRRQNTGFADGCWHLPAGHVEKYEPVPEALAREACEELGIHLDPRRLRLVHVMQQPGRVATFFAAEVWCGTIKNMEPDKCDQLGWFQSGMLPEKMAPYCRAALEAIGAGILFSTFGWDADTSERAA